MGSIKKKNYHVLFFKVDALVSVRGTLQENFKNIWGSSLIYL